MGGRTASRDRKSTRLNSSHLGISYAVFCLIWRPPCSTLFPYTTLFRSMLLEHLLVQGGNLLIHFLLGLFSLAEQILLFVALRLLSLDPELVRPGQELLGLLHGGKDRVARSEEHTSELQSLRHLVCRLLLDMAASLFYSLSLHDALPIYASRAPPCTGREPSHSLPARPVQPC